MPLLASLSAAERQGLKAESSNNGMDARSTGMESDTNATEMDGESDTNGMDVEDGIGDAMVEPFILHDRRDGGAAHPSSSSRPGVGKGLSAAAREFGRKLFVQLEHTKRYQCPGNLVRDRPVCETNTCIFHYHQNN